MITASQIIPKAAINDLVSITTKGCVFYAAWRGMITRCQNAKYKERRKTYKDCSVVDEWLTFSAFKEWMQGKDFHGMHLDKDIIVPGNKIYGPEFCAFVSPKTNGFVTDRTLDRGLLPLGVSYDPVNKKFKASCSNPFTNKQETVGRYESADAAHFAWRARKHAHAIKLAEMQSDERVAKALLLRYAP